MNKIKISSRLKSVIDQLESENYGNEEVFDNVIRYRNGIYIEHFNPIHTFCRQTKKYDMFEICDILKGFYVTETSKEDIVLQKYKENKKVCYDTYDEKELILHKGFNKGIEFVNEVYGLKIKFSEEKGNE